MKESRIETSWVFMLDGDNTLWDTNVVFTRAQMAVLRELQETGLRFTQNRGFRILRQIDDRLISHYHRHEYDFRALFLALFLYFSGNNQSNSVNMATRILKTKIPRELMKTVKLCEKVFHEEMRKNPPLFPGVKATFRAFRKRASILMLFSEGDVSRVSRLIRELSLARYFDELYVQKKTYTLYARARNHAFKRLKSRRSQIKVIVVGDLIDPDIKMGNRIGAITVLRVGGYRPNQHPRNKLEKPNYVIREIPELISIVEGEEQTGN